MKDLGLIIWLTQLGISVVSPLIGFVLLAIWLRDACGWGAWTVWVGAALGVICAVQGLVDSLRSMDKYIKRNKKQDAPPPVSFNNHE